MRTRGSSPGPGRSQMLRSPLRTLGASAEHTPQTGEENGLCATERFRSGTSAGQPCWRRAASRSVHSLPLPACPSGQLSPTARSQVLGQRGAGVASTATLAVEVSVEKTKQLARHLPRACRACRLTSPCNSVFKASSPDENGLMYGFL